ncbi:ADP-ribosyltransferase [Nocardia brasiliensis]|uniref:ADP-ribosyltransferase n=1 Tax=Nocardia brasiliensis TaxID=37326 RepID=UPI0024555A17|nr:ADP-ribosyltransferase [Nocardia brasiliensis]
MLATRLLRVLNDLTSELSFMLPLAVAEIRDRYRGHAQHIVNTTSTVTGTDHAVAGTYTDRGIAFDDVTPMRPAGREASKSDPDTAGQLGSPQPIARRPICQLPGFLIDGIRRFATDRDGQRYGESVLDPTFRDLTPDRQAEVLKWTSGGRATNHVLRPDGLPDRGTLERKLAEWHDNPTDDWLVYELADEGRRRLTLDDIHRLAERGDLNAMQQRIVDRILGAENPRNELTATLVRDAGMRTLLTSSYGRWPTAADVLRRYELLDDAVNNPLPEGLRVQRGLFNWDLLRLESSPYELVGRQFIDPGYTSASLGKHLDTRIAPTRTYVAHLTFDAPAGTPALWIGPHSRFPLQREILFPRNLAFEITKVSKGGTDLPLTTPWRLWATVVPS